ncbi:uncharacterized protein LOC118403020 [Branchiostoma floridae]|uniref:Uncharacterized protein LOC118403020 n=1 Tax=Branchiostoma floridae TaxID=7739 RepID=A0A9J7KD35_BRAFL|nr:uncharacterized protein LOC118403020 [Branchiostoma floridae]
MFVLCWGPYYGYAVVRDFFPRLLAKSRLNITLHYIVEAVAMGNSSIDTVVYIAMNGNVRKFMKKLPHDCYTAYMQWKNRRVQPASRSVTGGRRPADRRSSTRSDNTFPPSNFSNYRTRDVKEVFCIEDRKGTKSDVIYRLKCEGPQCNDTYIGETSQPLKASHSHLEPRWYERGVKEAIFERIYNPTLNRKGGLRVELSSTWDPALHHKRQ